jgi:hypothetical protein
MRVANLDPSYTVVCGIGTDKQSRIEVIDHEVIFEVRAEYFSCLV